MDSNTVYCPICGGPQALSGGKIFFIKHIREHLNCGLADCKRIADACWEAVDGSLEQVKVAMFKRELNALKAMINDHPYMPDAQKDRWLDRLAHVEQVG